MLSLGNSWNQLDNHDTSLLSFKENDRNKVLFLYFKIINMKGNDLILQLMLQKIKYLRNKMFLAFVCKGNYVHIEIHVS